MAAVLRMSRTCYIFNSLASDSGKSWQESLEKTKSIPVRKLIAKEIQQRREKGLCFNCDEKFHKNHKFTVKFTILLSNIDEQQEDDSEEALEFIPEVFVEKECAISYHPLAKDLVP